MNCKHCGAELTEDALVCPECGQEQATAQETAEENSEMEAAVETGKENGETEAAVETATEKTAEKKAEPMAKKEQKKTAWILGAAVVALFIIIGLLVWKIVRDTSDKPDEPTLDATAQPAEKPDTAEPENDLLSDAEDGAEAATNGVSYTVTEAELTEEVLERVVAKCGEVTLTNRALPIYYWQQYMSFANSYGYYLSYFMDTSLPLDQQMYDEESTWQQMFLESAIEMFRYQAAMAQQAEAEGMTLSSESQETLDRMEAELATTAESYGFSDADAYMAASYGPSVTAKEYIEFLRTYLLGYEYLNAQLEAQQPSDAEIEAYYDENAADYEANRVEKIDKPMVNIRHILIEAEAGEDGTVTEEAWAEAETRANEILNEWLAGEATEDAFAELANTYSADPGSNTNGGLYTDVYPGQMVTSFNDWCFADGRKVGDYGLVKSEEYGYFIIYFSGTSESVYWFETAKSDYLSDLSARIQDEVVARFDFEAHEEQSALVDMMFAGEATE